MSTTSSKPPHTADNAFWHALEERRDQIRDSGLEFDERSHHKFRKNHAEGRLISSLCAGVARYKSGRGDPKRLKAMAHVMKSGLPTWEDLLITRGEPWTPYVTDEARRGAQAAIADAKTIVPFV